MFTIEAFSICTGSVLKYKWGFSVWMEKYSLREEFKLRLLPSLRKAGSILRLSEEKPKNCRPISQCVHLFSAVRSLCQVQLHSWTAQNKNGNIRSSSRFWHSASAHSFLISAGCWMKPFCQLPATLRRKEKSQIPPPPNCIRFAFCTAYYRTTRNTICPYWSFQMQMRALSPSLCPADSCEAC